MNYIIIRTYTIKYIHMYSTICTSAVRHATHTSICVNKSMQKFLNRIEKFNVLLNVSGLEEFRQHEHEFFL